MKIRDQGIPAASTRPGPVVLAVLLPSLVVLVLHGYLGGHTRLIADDFCSAYFARRLGLLRSVWYWYNNWSGRYTAFGTDWVMERLGAYALPVIPPLVLLAWFVLTVIAIRLWLRRLLPDSKWTALTLGGVFLFVVLLLSPLVPQSLYWWNAMRSYSLPLVLLTAYIVLLQIGMERLRTKRDLWVGSLLSFLFLFANGGLGETYVAFQLGLLVAVVALEWFVHRDLNSVLFRLLFAGLLGSAAALVIVVLAPGNAVRQDLYPPHPGLILLLQLGVQNYLAFLSDIVQTPEKLAGLLGAVGTAFWLGTQTEQAAKQSWLVPVLFAGALLLSFACVLPAVYATSEPSAPRTMIVPVFILLAGWMAAGFILGGQWTSARSQSSRLVVPALAVGLIVYAALVNGLALYRDRTVYVEFAKRWQAADAQILQAKARGDKSVTIPAMHVWTGPGGDPTDNPKFWVNQCYSLYYDITVLGPNPEEAE